MHEPAQGGSNPSSQSVPCKGRQDSEEPKEYGTSRHCCPTGCVQGALTHHAITLDLGGSTSSWPAGPRAGKWNHRIASPASGQGTRRSPCSSSTAHSHTAAAGHRWRPRLQSSTHSSGHRTHHRYHSWGTDSTRSSTSAGAVLLPVAMLWSHSQDLEIQLGHDMHRVDEYGDDTFPEGAGDDHSHVGNNEFDDEHPAAGSSPSGVYEACTHMNECKHSMQSNNEAVARVIPTMAVAGVTGNSGPTKEYGASSSTGSLDCANGLSWRNCSCDGNA
eukprot:1875278-Amphidinium_carterae.1